MDVKGALHYVSRNHLLRTLKGMGVDGDLIKSTESFMYDRSEGLSIDSHWCTEPEVETEIPQVSPVLPILLAIYLRGVFRS